MKNKKYELFYVPGALIYQNKRILLLVPYLMLHEIKTDIISIFVFCVPFEFYVSFYLLADTLNIQGLGIYFKSIKVVSHMQKSTIDCILIVFVVDLS